MRVSREVLFVIAGLVWLAAGINILVIGLNAYGESLAAGAPLVWMLLGSVAIFAAFGAMFARIVRKHTARINGYGQEKQPFWRFFDKGSYIIMIFMMTLGISLRTFHLVPDWFIAFFYTGLGLALALAGVGFLLGWLRLARLKEQEA